MNNAPSQYSPVAKILHWWIAGMIVLQYILANLAESAEDAGSPARELALMANHRSVGITILIIAVLRLVWRRSHPLPAPLPMPAWQVRAAKISHMTFYVLLFALPITGWLMTSAAAEPATWFNLVQLPDIVGPDADLAEVFEEIHEVLAPVLAVLALIHIGAALKHAFIDRNDALQRISSAMSILIFIVIVVGGYLTLSDVDSDAIVQPGAEALEQDSGLPAE